MLVALRRTRWGVLAGLAAGVLAGAVPANATFPGGNGKITFSSNRNGTTQIFTMNSDGSAQMPLTADPVFAAEPAWSADGKTLAYDTFRHDALEIFVVDDRGGAQNVSHNTAADMEPTWSPTGTMLAFASDRDQGRFQIYTMTMSPKHRHSVTQLTSGDQESSQPRWSPDGTKIAYESVVLGSHEIFVMNADGTGQTNLTQSPGHDEMWPSWSPDGTKIAFQSDAGEGGNLDIFVMNADGSGMTRLTTSSEYDVAPVWSPDGAKIAFQSNRDGNDDIYVMNTDGTGQTRLTNDPAIDSGPEWQPVVS
jgi:Tol biopolymer transport system component